MRRTLREVGRIRAGSSDVVLRMSVGVHSGSYAMFFVGGSHRELLIGGPATSTVVAMESLASAGQILISADTAKLLPRGSLGNQIGEGVLLARAPAASDWNVTTGWSGRTTKRLPVACRAGPRACPGRACRARASNSDDRLPPVHRARSDDRAGGAAERGRRDSMRSCAWCRMRPTATRSASSTRTSPPTGARSASAPAPTGGR